MLTSQARRFGEALVDRHVITREAMEGALDEASQTGEEFSDLVERRAGVGPKDMAAGWAAAMGIPFVDFSSEVVHPDAGSLIPEDVARKHHVVGVRLEDHHLTVAFAVPIEPETLRVVGEAVAAAKADLVVAAAEAGELEDAITAVYGGTASVRVGATHGEPSTELYRLFGRVIELNGSDLHLAAGQPPFVRLVGELVRMPDEPVISAAKVRELVYSILTVRQQERFEHNRELDTAHAMPGRVRFRVNVFVQRNAVGAAFRVIPFDVVPFDDLGLPAVVKTFASLPRGLVLVTGPTGSGKSTTLASLVDIVNSQRQAHIMTIEDPIEFVHKSKAALVNQREVGDDTESFGGALKSALRQDPDVILVGEMRDLETIGTAITAAETGHLVFATLHTQDAASTIDRIVDVFPGEQQGQVRVQVANSIQGITSQQLIPTVDNRSRAVACEVLIANVAIRSLIRDGKVHQIHNAMTSGKRQGMQSMDDSLARLVSDGIITLEQASLRAAHPDDLERLVAIR